MVRLHTLSSFRTVRRFDRVSRIPIPFAVYQFVEKRVVTIAISACFCKLFGYTDPCHAYYDMDHDMYRNVHPDDAGRMDISLPPG